jgi:L-fuculose-phosphate aldolase
MLTAIGDVMRECYKRGWITTRDGNISLRKSLDGNISEFMYITPRGTRKTTIHPEHVIKLNMHADTRKMNVSTEFYMHHNLLIDAETTRAIVHVHPTHVVAAMFAGWDLQEIAKQFPELKRYTLVGPTVRFHEAGSHDLAHETNLRMRDGNEKNPIGYDIVGQQCHGVCAVGKHPWDAFEHVERLNHICEIVLASGVKPPTVTQSRVSDK